MFDKKSDYALNRRSKDSIIYIGTIGLIRLTREDFHSEEEFLKWKRWSDGDYRDTEKAGRDFYDNGIPLDERLDVIGAVLSVEDALFLALEEAEAEAKRIQKRTELMEQIRSLLTKTQFRRLWLYYVEQLNEREIAVIEGVGQQRVSKSLTASKKILEDLALKYENRG